jgi:hypothetical protein
MDVVFGREVCQLVVEQRQDGEHPAAGIALSPLHTTRARSVSVKCDDRHGERCPFGAGDAPKWRGLDWIGLISGFISVSKTWGGWAAKSRAHKED